MPTPPISRLPAAERQELLNDLNYLNTAEIRSFCKIHSIPYTISIETADGRRKKTSDADRKGVVLNRIRHFLNTADVIEETCFPSTVVGPRALPRRISPDDQLFYGHYDKKSSAMIALLKELTDGEFRNGAIARILARDFWSRGIAPTFTEFALAWKQAVLGHKQPSPEWAFLSDLARGTVGADWKRMRARKAAKVLATLKRITPVS